MPHNAKETDLGFAKLDLDRLRRRGQPEVVYGAGKSAEQLVKIFHAMAKAGQNAFATRVCAGHAAAVQQVIPDAVYNPIARTLTRDIAPLPRRRGKVAVLCAGTSDMPVAEEAAVTAYVQTLGPTQNLRIESHQAKIFELEDNADLIVTPESTVISEAIMFKKPVIIMNYTGFSLALSYESCRFAIQVRDKQQLRQVILEILDRNEKKSDFIDPQNEDLSFFIGRLDGQSTKRVADYISSNLLRKN